MTQANLIKIERMRDAIEDRKKELKMLWSAIISQTKAPYRPIWLTKQ